MKIDSDPNEMIATHPEMKAEEVCEKTIKALQSGEFKFLRVNFANGDMVGHTGNIEAAAFRLDFVDSMSVGDIVEVAGQFNVHRGAEQIEILDMFVVEEAYSNAFTKKLEKHLDSISEPPQTELLVKSNVLTLLQPKFFSVAKRLRRAFFESQPIIIRHHNDCDGICAVRHRRACGPLSRRVPRERHMA